MSVRFRSAMILAAIAAAIVLSDNFFLYYRDNFTTHYPTLTFASSVMRQGEIPLWNPLAPGGQPLGGDSNYLLFYPTTLLYLVLPPHLAFNLHFLIHLCLAWFAMRQLARRFGASRGSATWGASAYVSSGVVVSCLGFYNLIAAAAWIPLALACVVALRETRSLRDAAALGVSTGLLVLCAEPVTLFGFVIVALALLLGRSVAALLPKLAVALIVAIAVSSPLLIAYGEIAGEVERFVEGFDADTALMASVGPVKSIEILTGPPRGSVLDSSSKGLLANVKRAERPPFFTSVMLGALLIPALFAGWRGRHRRLVVAVVILWLFALGSWNPLVVAAVREIRILRILRNPEKILIAMTVVGSGLIALLLDDIRSRRARIGALAGVIVLVGGSAAVFATVSLTPGARVQFAVMALLQIFALAAVIGSARLKSAHRLAASLTIIALLYWVPLSVAIARSFWFVTPSPLAAQLTGSRIYTGFVHSDPAHDGYRARAFRLTPFFGFSYGIAYALVASPDGMYAWRTGLVTRHAVAHGLGSLLKYVRIYGVDSLLSDGRIPSPDVTGRGGEIFEGKPTYIATIRDPRPPLTIAPRVFAVRTEEEAMRTIESPAFDVVSDAVCVGCRIAGSRGSATIVRKSTQGMTLEVSAPAGGLVVTDQSYFRAWSARNARGDELRTLPVNVDRLGIIAPPGVSRIEIVFSRRRHVIAIAWALSLAVMCASLLAVLRRSRFSTGSVPDRRPNAME